MVVNSRASGVEFTVTSFPPLPVKLAGVSVNPTNVPAPALSSTYFLLATS